MKKGKNILLYSVLVVVGTYFFFKGLSEAQTFLIPVITATILALLMLPLSQKMEKRFANRASSSLLNTFILFLISVGFFALVSFQIKTFVDDWDNVKKTMEPKIEQLRNFVLEHTPLEPEDLEQTDGDDGESGQGGKQEKTEEEGSKEQTVAGSSIASISSGTNPGKEAAAFFGGFISFMGNYLLTFVYVFFLLNYRSRFKEFLLRLFADKRSEVKTVINNSARVTQKYLVGKFILIFILAVLYAIGLGISGVDNFILISLLAALFSLIPYIGNIMGFVLAIALGYVTSGELSVLIGIVLTFSVAQFVESYILEPYIVGDQVDIHPFFVIVSVIVGSMVWGPMGMILAIPVLAIVNVVFLNIKSLKPFGYLLSNQEID